MCGSESVCDWGVLGCVESVRSTTTQKLLSLTHYSDTPVQIVHISSPIMSKSYLVSFLNMLQLFLK